MPRDTGDALEACRVEIEVRIVVIGSLKHPFINPDTGWAVSESRRIGAEHPDSPVSGPIVPRGVVLFTILVPDPGKASLPFPVDKGGPPTSPDALGGLELSESLRPRFRWFPSRRRTPAALWLPAAAAHHISAASSLSPNGGHEEDPAELDPYF